MKSDTAIERNVEAELSWNPEIDATDIALNVHSGVVALSAWAGSYEMDLPSGWQNIQAVVHEGRAALEGAVGVTNVSNELTVRT
jgi:osmotically-inducible protein OsmY